MYSDLLFNFSKLAEDNGIDEATDILLRMTMHQPFFALDTGISNNDIFRRTEQYRQCVQMLEDEDNQKTAFDMIYFSAGVMSDYDSVQNCYDEVEKLEHNITSFKNSDDDFASKLIAIGTCGIDHDWESVEYEGRSHDYFDRDTICDERNLFALQLTLGKKLNMPVIVHSRKGFRDTMDVISAVKWNKGVIHGFDYSLSELKYFLDLGWYISFNGTVTYSGRKAFNDMAEVVSYVPKDRIFVESDSPYYAPVPLKNVSNTPDKINYIYEYIAAKRGMSIHKLCDQTDKNFKTLFNL